MNKTWFAAFLIFIFSTPALAVDEPDEFIVSAARNDTFDFRVEPLWQARFYQHRIRSRHSRAPDVVFQRIAGDDDDRDSRGQVVGSKDLAEVEAAHPGKPRLGPRPRDTG